LGVGEGVGVWAYDSEMTLVNRATPKRKARGLVFMRIEVEGFFI
jgi:hypothetical protein